MDLKIVLDRDVVTTG